MNSRRIFEPVGQVALAFFNGYGRMTILFLQTLKAFRRIPRYARQIFDQYTYIGRRSVPMVLIASIFVGFVLGVQIATQISPDTPTWIEAGLIFRSVMLEMGPIITGLILAGRVSSGIAAEIGTMVVTEQVDALRTMGIDPIEFLVLPRLVAGMIAMPMLTILFDFDAILAGFVSTYYTIDLRWPGFVRGMRSVFATTDVYTSIIKGLLNGMIITTIGSFFGLEAKKGAKGVGSATTNAVVAACIVIIMVDYVISASLYHLW